MQHLCSCWDVLFSSEDTVDILNCYSTSDPCCLLTTEVPRETEVAGGRISSSASQGFYRRSKVIVICLCCWLSFYVWVQPILQPSGAHVTQANYALSEGVQCSLKLLMWSTIFHAGHLTQETRGYATSALMQTDIFKPANVGAIQVPNSHDRSLNAC